MPLLHSGPINVQYGQAYIEAGTQFDGDMARCFAGQSTGICGGAVLGMLFLVTGLHTGIVLLDIEFFEADPGIFPDWEDVVEVSLQVRGGPVALVEWAEETGRPLALLAGAYRARYSARHMEAGNAADTNACPAPIDTYRLDLWPASTAPDAIIRQSAEIAAYWHGWAQGLNPA